MNDVSKASLILEAPRVQSSQPCLQSSLISFSGTTPMDRQLEQGNLISIRDCTDLFFFLPLKLMPTNTWILPTVRGVGGEGIESFYSGISFTDTIQYGKELTSRTTESRSFFTA